jgi:CBS domain-containing protein
MGVLACCDRGESNKSMNTKLVSSIGAATRSRLVTVSDDTLLVDVAKLLSDTQISLIVVCDSAGAMVGVITKTNIVRLIGHCRGSSCRTPAADVMTPNVTSCRATDFLPDVLTMMAKHGFVHIPVIDEHFKPLGVVNARDALRALLAEEEYEGALLRDYVMGIGYQ